MFQPGSWPPPAPSNPRTWLATSSTSSTKPSPSGDPTRSSAWSHNLPNTAAQSGMTPIAQTCDGTFALGKCWKAFQALVTWQDAETVCVAWGGHLASITSASEQAFAANISLDVYTWIGFHDPVGSHSTADWSNFAWSDGSPGGMSGYTGWCRNPNGENVEPNNAGSENCATLYPRSTSGSRCWNDHPCSNGGVIGSYLCKR